MTLARPTVRLDFANNPGFIDPRFAFTRAGPATYTDRHGVRRTASANAPRFDFDPVTGRSRGLLQEGPRTNLALRSGELDNAAWTKTNLTVTANQAIGADGTAVLESLVATGVTGTCAQAVTITAGNAITASIYARLFASSFVIISVTEGANQVQAWFNLSTGATGTNTAGSGTCVFAFKDIEDCGGGLYRCSLTVSTNTATSFTVAFAPAATDGGATASTNSIYASEVQIESPGTVSHASSYIATTTVAVTRPTDLLVAPTTGSWYNASEGTLVIDYLTVRRHPASANVLGGLGNTFNDTIYFSQNLTGLSLAVTSGGVQQALLNKTLVVANGTRNRMAFAWKVNDMALVVNGGVASVDTVAALPVGMVRMIVGGSPWGAFGSGCINSPLSQFAYYPRRLTEAQMQALTVAP